MPASKHAGHRLTRGAGGTLPALSNPELTLGSPDPFDFTIYYPSGAAGDTLVIHWTINGGSAGTDSEVLDDELRDENALIVFELFAAAIAGASPGDDFDWYIVSQRTGYTDGLSNTLTADVPAPSSFVPTDATSLVAWYDADQQVESADAAVATVVDQKASYDFTQATSGFRAVLRYAAINGKKALEFNGTDNGYTSATSLMDGATAGSYFAVVKLDDATPDGGGGPILNAFGTGTGSVSPFANGLFYESFGLATRIDAIDPGAAVLTSAFIYSAHISAAGAYKVYINGVQIHSSTGNTVAFGTATREMGRVGVSSNVIDGLIAEVIICNDDLIGDADFDSMNEYLADKYGISI